MGFALRHLAGRTPLVQSWSRRAQLRRQTGLLCMTLPRLADSWDVACRDGCFLKLPVRHNSLAQAVRCWVLNFNADVEKGICPEMVAGRASRLKDSNRRLRNRIARHGIVVALNIDVRVPDVEYSVFFRAVAIALQANVFEHGCGEHSVVTYVRAISIHEYANLADSRRIVRNAYVVRLRHRNIRRHRLATGDGCARRPNIVRDYVVANRAPRCKSDLNAVLRGTGRRTNPGDNVAVNSRRRSGLVRRDAVLLIIMNRTVRDLDVRALPGSTLDKNACSALTRIQRSAESKVAHRGMPQTSRRISKVNSNQSRRAARNSIVNSVHGQA